jgi:hypothetical protein
MRFWSASLGINREADLLLFVAFTFFFCVFSPEIACQVQKPPNSLKQKQIEVEI